jgi:chromosome segregation ATPase
MSNRAIRRAIQSLREQIEAHEQKIAQEKGRSEPNEGVIHHWEREIETFTIRLHRLEERLARQRRRGR